VSSDHAARIRPLCKQALANRPRRSAAWLEATYPMPRSTRSLEEYLRRQHQDLPSPSGLDIALELDAVR
jgi:hypothetical protein